MASVVTDAKMVSTNDMEIPSLEPPRASAKSKEVKEIGLGLDDPSKTVSTDDMEIPELELSRASTKSKEVKEVSLGLDDPSKTVKIGAHLDPK